MTIKADEISRIIKEQLGDYALDVDVAEVGTVVSVGDGIARLHGIERAMATEMPRVPARDLRHRVEPRGGRRRRGAARGVDRDQGRRYGQADRAGHVGAGRRRDARPGRQRPRTAARRQGPDRRGAAVAGGADCARGGRPPAGQGAAPDRPQGDRRHDSDRARPARADHRRPADRQDRDSRRHHHQPEGARRRLHLQRHRPEAVDDRAGGQDARGRGRDGVHHRGRGGRVGAGPAALHQPLLGLRGRRVLP